MQSVRWRKRAQYDRLPSRKRACSSSAAAVRFTSAQRDAARLRGKFTFGITTLPRERLTELMWLSAGQVATLLLSLLSIKLTTSIGPAEYGKYTLVMTVAGILSMTFFGPLEQGFVRLYFDYGGSASRRTAFRDSFLQAIVLSFGVLAAMSLAATLFLHHLLSFEVSFLFAASFLIVSNVLGGPLNGMLNTMRLRRQVAIIQVLERLAIIVLLWFTLTTYAATATGIMFALGFAGALFFLVRLTLFRRQAQSAPEEAGVENNVLRKEISRGIIAYAAPFAAWGAISWLQLNGERWIINGMLASADVGRFGLAATLINSSAGFLFTVGTQFIVPIVYARFSHGEPWKGVAFIRTYALATAAVFLAAALLLFLFGDTIVSIVSTKAFTVEGRLLFLLTVGIGMFCVGQAQTTLALALKKPNAYMTSKIVIAMLSVPAYWIGCSLYGLLGVALAVCLVNTFYLLAIVRVNHSLLHSLRTDTPA